MIINHGLHQQPNLVVRNSCLLPPTACKYHPCGHFTFSLLVGGTPLQISPLLLFNLFSSQFTPGVQQFSAEIFTQPKIVGHLCNV